MPIFAPSSSLALVAFDKSGTLVGTRSKLNLIEGANVSIALVDNPAQNRVDATVALAPASFWTTLLSLNPASAWNLDETGNPASTTVTAADVNSLVNGTYGPGSLTQQSPLPASGSSFAAKFAASTAYVNLGSSSYSFQGTSGNVFSWCAWVNPTATSAGAYGNMLTSWFSNASGGQGYWVTAFGATSTTYDLAFTRQVNGASVSAATGGGPYTVGTRHFVAVTYDGSSLRLYVDGASVTTALDTRALVSGASSLYLGNWPTLTSRYLNGLGDAYAVWTRALSASEITTLYNAGT